jgi:hypothetical protein
MSSVRKQARYWVQNIDDVIEDAVYKYKKNTNTTDRTPYFISPRSLEHIRIQVANIVHQRVGDAVTEVMEQCR